MRGLSEHRKAINDQEAHRTLNQIDDRAFEVVVSDFARAELELARAKEKVQEYLGLENGKELLVEINWTRIRRAGLLLLEQGR